MHASHLALILSPRVISREKLIMEQKFCFCIWQKCPTIFVFTNHTADAMALSRTFQAELGYFFLSERTEKLHLVIAFFIYVDVDNTVTGTFTSYCVSFLKKKTSFIDGHSFDPQRK